MDDVFFSYITGVLEELGSPESSEETFDMDTFIEMMEAYIPGFAEIPRYVSATALYVHATQWVSGPNQLNDMNSFVVPRWGGVSSRPVPQ